MRKIFERFISRIQSNPQKAAGFFVGVFVPLAFAGLFWAQTTGGLAGPLVDPRPQAFVVLAD